MSSPSPADDPPSGSGSGSGSTPGPARYNQRNPAIKRILQEMREMAEDDTPHFYAEAVESDIFEWHFAILGADGSDFDGGIYHGRILLPAEYPFKPPSFVLLTPSGRFETHTKICLSMTAHHPEHWQPSWSVRTALTAVRAFMPTPAEGAIGSLDHTPEERRALARRSRSPDAAPVFGSPERQALTDRVHALMRARADEALERKIVEEKRLEREKEIEEAATRFQKLAEAEGRAPMSAEAYRALAEEAAEAAEKEEEARARARNTREEEGGAEKEEDGAEKKEDGAEREEDGAEREEDGAEGEEDGAEGEENAASASGASASGASALASGASTSASGASEAPVGTNAPPPVETKAPSSVEDLVASLVRPSPPSSPAAARAPRPPRRLGGFEEGREDEALPAEEEAKAEAAGPEAAGSSSEPAKKAAGDGDARRTPDANGLEASDASDENADAPKTKTDPTTVPAESSPLPGEASSSASPPPRTVNPSASDVGRSAASKDVPSRRGEDGNENENAPAAAAAAPSPAEDSPAVARLKRQLDRTAMWLIAAIVAILIRKALRVYGFGEEGEL